MSVKNFSMESLFTKNSFKKFRKRTCLVFISRLPLTYLTIYWWKDGSEYEKNNKKEGLFLRKVL